ncbi:hypothetical protein WA158_007771 [Blastocystis sp. Blastoise]
MWLFVAHACSSTEYEIKVQRNYARNHGEIVKLTNLEQSFLRNDVVFFDESSSEYDSMVSYKACLNKNTDYILELSSKNSASWAKDSYVTLMFNQIIIVNSRVAEADNGKKSIKFNLSSLLDSNNNWKYSTAVDTASWKESKLEEWGEDYNNKEIKNAGITTYFRKDIIVDNSFAVLQLSIQSQSGFIVYVNGIQVFSDIESTVPSQSIENIPTYKQVLVPREIFDACTSLTTLKIAIELHTTKDHPELLSSFNVFSYITHDINFVDVLSPLSIRCNTLSSLSEMDCNSLFKQNNIKSITFKDHSASFYISNVSSSSINGYKVLFSNNNYPKSVKVYGYNNIKQRWSILDVNNQLNITTISKLSLNNNQFKYYRFDISSDTSFDISYIQLLYIPTFTLPLCSSSPMDIKPRKLETSQVHIQVNRVTKNNDNGEYIVIKTEDGNTVATLEQDSFLENTYDYYGPSGKWSFNLASRVVSSWSPGSYMTVSIIDDEADFIMTVAKMYLIDVDNNLYYVNTDVSVPSKSEWKYNTYSNLPFLWFGSSVNDAKWRTINCENGIVQDESDRYFVFRKTIVTPSINNQKYFLLHLKTIFNSKIYINKHEMATYNFKDGYENSHLITEFIKRSIIGPLSFFDNQPTITISILMFDSQHTEDISFYEHGITDYLFDLDPITYMYFSHSSFPTLDPKLTFEDHDGFKYINKYCIVRSDQIDQTPYSWIVESIDLSGQKHIHSQVSDPYKDVNSSMRLCFKLYNMTSTITNLVFTFFDNYKHDSNYYYISQIEFYIDADSSLETVPLFSYSSNPVAFYTNTNVNLELSNVEYYHDFSITPSFSNGLSIDPNTGLISGLLNNDESEIDYVIHAVSILNTPYDYSLTIQTIICPGSYELARFELNYDVNLDYIFNIDYEYSWESRTGKEYAWKAIYAKDQFNKGGSETISLCLAPEHYKVYFYTSPPTDDTLRDSYVYINNILYGKINSDIPYFSLNIQQYANSENMPIIYSYEKVSPPANWNTNTFNDNVWSTALRSAFLPIVPEDSITQYYRMHYNVTNLDDMPNRFVVSVSTYAGIVAYINGVQIFQKNMPTGVTPNYTTIASKSFNEYKEYKIITSVSAFKNIFRSGDNIIAIEIHKYNDIIQPTNQLKFSIDYYYKKDIIRNNRIWTTNDDYNGDTSVLSYLDDKDDQGNYMDSTITELSRSCENATFVYTYEDDMYGIVKMVLVSSYNDKSEYYKPTSFNIEGYDDDTNTWINITTVSGFDQYYYANYVFLDNRNAYHSYRIVVNECGIGKGSQPDEQKIVLNVLDFVVSSEYTCMRLGWETVDLDEISHEICSPGYEGNATRVCTYKGFDYIEGESSCSPIKPTYIYFKNTDIILKNGKENSVYFTMNGLDTQISTNSSLPDGISIDLDSQRLYGIPTQVSDRTQYSLLFKNSDGNDEQYDIYITVEDAFCESNGEWPRTESSTYATMNSCPTGYSGSVKRYCNDDMIWEEPNMEDCYVAYTPCTGTTYYSGSECIECVNGIISSLNGNNYGCTPCEEGTYIYNNKCYEHPYCEADGDWSQTNPENTVTIPCPTGYYGSMTRYCNNDMMWEEKDTSNCIELPHCTGTTYLSGTECLECVNGIISVENGYNTGCTPCENSEFVYQNECYPLDATCPATTIDSFIYPETRIKMNVLINCTNDEQYGYYQLFCDYILKQATWSNSINSELCYSRPPLVPGKVLQEESYTIKLTSPISDVFTVLVTLARSFVNSYPYQLTDLLLTTDYNTEKEFSGSLDLHINYGSSMDAYSYSSSLTSSSTNQNKFINTITSIKNSPFSASSSFDSTDNVKQDSVVYCQDENNNQIPFNSYVSEKQIIDQIIRFDIYFCKQDKLEYVLAPITIKTTSTSNNFGLSIGFIGIQKTSIRPDTFISIYRSILKATYVSISNMKILRMDSSTNDEELYMFYSISFPPEVTVDYSNTSNPNWYDQVLLRELIEKSIPFKFTSLVITQDELPK